MTSHLYHLAQVNIARARASLDDPLMADFVARLDEINALADGSPGFIWRLQSEGGEAPATYLRPYEDERIIFNLSVWESIEQFKEYVYATAHGEVMRRRRDWFEKFEGMYQAMWWVKAEHIPTIAEAKQRLEYLEAHGETAHAFTLKRPFPPTENEPEEFIAPPLISPCLA